MGQVNLFDCIKVIVNSTEAHLGSGDNRGFSSSDIHDGMRLGARIKSGKFLRNEEITLAKELVLKYQSQLLESYSIQSGQKKEAFINFVKRGDLYPYNPNYEKYESYLTISNNRKHLFIYDIDGKLQSTIWNELKDYHKTLFGERKIFVKYEREFHYRYAGLSFSTTRWKITFIEEMRRQLIDFARAKNILINPLVFKKMTKEQIFLSRHKNICSIRNAVRNGVSGSYFVLDMQEATEEMTDKIKASFESYSCRKEDDYDWYILATEQSVSELKPFVVEYSFICDAKARAFLFER